MSSDWAGVAEPLNHCRGCKGPRVDALDELARRCPFMRAVADNRLGDAWTLATQGPDPAEPAVFNWLVTEARRQIRGGATTTPPSSPAEDA